jgi:hypothetical protein
VPAEEQNAPTMGQPALNPEGTRPAPLGGIKPGERPSALELDFASAAVKLGVTEQELRNTLGELGQRPPDLATAAAILGISEDSLREAFGFPEGGPPPGGPPPDDPNGMGHEE